MTNGHCPSWRDPRVLLILFSVFLCGVTAGGLIMRYGVHEWAHQPAPALPADIKAASLERLTKDLDLTPEQTRNLEMVLDDFVKYVQMLQAQMDDVRANGKQRILMILNDKQKKKFENMLADVQSRQRAAR